MLLYLASTIPDQLLLDSSWSPRLRLRRVVPALSWLFSGVVGLVPGWSRSPRRLNRRRWILVC